MDSCLADPLHVRCLDSLLYGRNALTHSGDNMTTQTQAQAQTQTATGREPNSWRFLVVMPAALGGHVAVRTNDKAYALSNMRRGFMAHGGTLYEQVQS